MRSNRYGFYGDAVGEGVKALTRFAPNGIVLRNTLAGAAAKLYPTGNDFPTTAQWLADLANPGRGDYRLTANALSLRAGTDGKDVGVDFVELDAATSDRQRQQHRTAVAARSVRKVAAPDGWLIRSDTAHLEGRLSGRYCVACAHAVC